VSQIDIRFNRYKDQRIRSDKEVETKQSLTIPYNEVFQVILPKLATSALKRLVRSPDVLRVVFPLSCVSTSDSVLPIEEIGREPNPAACVGRECGKGTAIQSF
jgi:hypothetical protein